jgi:hypothetical protein
VVEKSNVKNFLTYRYEKLSLIIFPFCRFAGFKLISAVSGVQIPAPPPNLFNKIGRYAFV